LLFFTATLQARENKGDLDRYVERLRLSYASGGKETAFLSAGFLYGQDYFAAGNYFSASGYFMDVLKRTAPTAG
jgi:hypothetical protein